MVRERNDVDELQRRMGYVFRDESLLEQALTQGSAGEGHPAADNRRLAFLGDAVLELAIREGCYETTRLATRGDLSVEADKFVPDTEVARRARLIELGAWIHTGRGESKNKLGEGRRLADAFEAVVGAMYLEIRDQSFPIVRQLMGQRT